MFGWIRRLRRQGPVKPRMHTVIVDGKIVIRTGGVTAIAPISIVTTSTADATAELFRVMSQVVKDVRVVRSYGDRNEVERLVASMQRKKEAEEDGEVQP